MTPKSLPAWLAAGCTATLMACSVPVSTNHLLPEPPDEVALSLDEPVSGGPLGGRPPEADPGGNPPSAAPGDQERVPFRGDPWDQDRRRYDDDRDDYRYRRRSRGRSPSFYALASGAVGDYDVFDDALGNGRSDAYMQRFQIGAIGRRGTGGGIDVKWIIPEDDYYEGTINETDFNQLDIYAHFTMQPSTRERVRVPIRVGPYFSRHAAEFTRTGDDTIYSSLGIRLEVEPEIVLVADQNGAMSIYGRFSGGLHTTDIDDDSTDQDYHSDGFTLGLEAGVRAALGPLTLSGAYIYHESTNDESEVERGLVIPRLETEFSGFQFTMGVRF